MGTTPGSTAPSLSLPDVIRVPPPQVGVGDGTDGRVVPCDALVYSVYSPVALPCPQNELPRVAKLFCSVPVPVQPSVTDVIFSPLAAVAEVSPLRLDQFQLELRLHPDRSAVAYVISGIQEGFRIGFEASSVSLKSVSSNMRSSLEHPSVIDSYLQSEDSARRVAGPFPSPPVAPLHISRFGVIPKNKQPGKMASDFGLVITRGPQRERWYL